MSERIHRALLISLCIHIMFLIFLTFMLYKEAVYKDEGKSTVIADIIPPIKPRTILPKFELESNTPAERREFGKVIKSFSFSPNDIDIDQPSFNKVVASADHSSQDSTPQFDEAIVSTVAEGLRTDEATIPSASVYGGGSGTGQGLGGGRGRGGFGRQYSQRRISTESVLEYIDSTENDDEIAQESPEKPELPELKSLKLLAEDIVADSDGPIDVVFVIDTSGSMGDNIQMVAEHLSEMIDVYETSDIDYALGLVTFRVPPSGRRRYSRYYLYERPQRKNSIDIWQLTKDWKRYKSILQGLSAQGDEHAYDAIYEAISKVRFRRKSQKYFILTTDEPFTSAIGLNFKRIVAACNESGIKVNVLGADDLQHRSLAVKTGGYWRQIPSAPRPPQPQRQTRQRRMGQSRLQRQIDRRYASRQLRQATWTKTSEISTFTLTKMGTRKVDIILFIDSSRSMEDKLPQFLIQLLNMIRNWDKAQLDYQLGAVRFRTGTGNFNYINVYQPPQTIEQVKSILALPCQGNERVLDAMVEGFRQLQFRPDAQLHIILVTDEPSTGEYSKDAVINMYLAAGAIVSVIGTIDPFQQEIVEQTQGIWMPIPDGKMTNESAW